MRIDPKYLSGDFAWVIVFGTIAAALVSMLIIAIVCDVSRHFGVS